MFKMVYMIFLILIQNDSAELFEITTPDPFDKCAMHTDDFWALYIKHFRLVSLLKFTILQTDEHHFGVHQFSQSFFKVLVNKRLHYLDAYYYTIKIRQESLNISSKSPFRYDPIKEDGNFENPLEITSDEELIRVKMLTSDSVEGYVIIVWDADDLRHFLDKNYRAVIPKARSTYAIFFVFTSTDSCSAVKNQINYILNRFWLEYSVVNVVAQTVCSCDNSRVYIHRPFVRIANSWGITQSYTMREANETISLVTSTLSNLNQFPLPVSLFNKAPTAVRTLPKLLQNNPIYRNLSFSKGFAGSDGMILGTLAKYLNFNAVFDSDSSLSHGRVEDNGTITGVLSQVLNRKSQFGGNGRFLANYHVDEIEFTVPFGSDKICIAVPKARSVPRWQTLFLSFSILIWIMILAACIVCVVFWYMVRPTSFIKASWEMYSCFMGIPFKIVPSWSQFFFLTSCMMFNVIVMGILQGSLFTDFTTKNYYQDMDSLEEVDRSGLPIMAYIWFLIKDESVLIERLREKSIDFNEEMFDMAVFDRSIAIMDRKLDLDILARIKYLEEDGTPRLHIVSECLTTFLTVDIVPKGSAFLTIFNTMITQLVESGLTLKWFEDVVDSMFIETVTKMVEREMSSPFTLDDLQAAFLVIAFGYTCSTVIFFIEILSKCKSFRNVFVK